MCCYSQEYETKTGRAGPDNPTSPRQSVRKNLDFEPLSTTALILEDRPAYVNTRILDLWVVRLSHIFHSLSHCQWSLLIRQWNHISSLPIVIFTSFLLYQLSFLCQVIRLLSVLFQLSVSSFVLQTVKEKCCWKFNDPPSTWLHYPFLFFFSFFFFKKAFYIL